jgi:hypothetical protein
MVNYALLIAIWPSLTGTTAQKLATLNAMTAGIRVDVTVPQVVGYLLLQGIFPTLQAFANGTTGQAAALQAAKTLMAWLSIPNAPNIQLSNPTVLATVQTMGNAIVAQETATPGSTGFTQTVLNGLIALSEETVPWWQANGFTLPITLNDLYAAGGLT